MEEKRNILKFEKDWQRLERIINWTGLSVEDLAENIGLCNSDIFYRIKRSEIGIMPDLSDRIWMRYPELNREWILRGKGTMRGLDTACLNDLPDDKMVDVDVREGSNTYHVHLRLRNDIDPELFDSMVRTIGLGMRTLQSRKNLNE